MPIPAKLRAPGWYRAALFDVLGFGFAFGLTVLIRTLMHEHPVVDGHAITIVALIAVPLFFLVGLGTADYWFYWAAGKATCSCARRRRSSLWLLTCFGSTARACWIRP